MNDAKSFQRIRSLVEARQVYSRLSQERVEVFCKGEGALFGLVAELFDVEQGVRGVFIGLEEGLIQNENVMVNFVLGADRYYTISPFVIEGSRGWLRLSENLYKLERRSYFRLPVPPNWDHGCNLIAHGTRAKFVALELENISQGGARFRVPSKDLPDLRDGDVLRVVLHVRDKWKLEIEGEVLRVVQQVVQQEDQLQFGFRFRVQDERLKRRLMAMMMEIQRETWRQR